MRQARVIGYLVVGVLLPCLAACGSIPGLRTSMPPVPQDEATPGAAAPAQAPAQGQAQAQAPALNLTQQVQNLELRVQQLESRVAELEGAKGAPATAKEHVLPAPSTPQAPKATASGAAVEKYYTEGMRLYHAKKFSGARNEFHQYLKNQPRGPRAQEARFYLADSFYQEGKYREAGVEFNKLRIQFPKSVLVPGSLLRQALCYKNQQQMSAYRSTLNKLVKSYPNTPEGKEAKKMLKESHK